MKDVVMVAVDSSNINSIGYSVHESTLYISFHKGGTYAYYGVKASTFDAILKAPSKGSYFIRYVKKVYPCEKVRY